MIFCDVLEALREASLSRGERLLLFQELLAATGGPWSEREEDEGSTFREYVSAVIRAKVNVKRRFGVPEAILEPEDIESEVLVSLFSALPKVTIPIHEWTVNAVDVEVRRTIRKAGTQLYARSIEADRELGIEPLGVASPEPWTDDELAAAEELEQLVTAAVQRLSPAVRDLAVIKLFKAPRLTLVELAARLGITPENARKRWQRARDTLKKDLSGYDLSLFMRERRLVRIR